MTTSNKSFLLYLLVFLGATLADISSKFLIKSYMEQNAIVSLNILPFLNIVSVWNKGISFGLFSFFNLSAWFWLAVNAAVICVIYWVINKWIGFYSYSKLAFTLIIAGACGNNFDRFYHGAVFDFIDLYIGNYHWPAFNLADSFVTCSAIILILIPTKKNA